MVSYKRKIGNCTFSAKHFYVCDDEEDIQDEDDEKIIKHPFKNKSNKFRFCGTYDKVYTKNESE